jgi:formate dehydrogenase iron-sulfur subunit
MAIKAGEARALLIDITRCVGCRACAAACKESHGFPGDPADDKDLGARAYTVVLDKGGDRYVRRLCMHCVDPSCASACPVSALRKTPTGPVVYDASRCLGCRYCMVACPFSVPRYEWDNPIPAVRKCDLCASRLAEGGINACAEACAFEATVAGTREELLAEAHRRIRENKDAYYPHVYGEEEVGGTSVLFLSPVPFEDLGFKVNLGSRPLPELTWNALEKIPGLVTVGGAAMFAVWWITNRREEVQASLARPHKDPPTRTGPSDDGSRS